MSVNPLAMITSAYHPGANFLSALPGYALSSQMGCWECLVWNDPQYHSTEIGNVGGSWPNLACRDVASLSS
jgi:hypothetical protein